MPRIPYIEQQQGLGGPPDLAMARPNQALSETEQFLETQAQHDAAIQGLNMLSDFKVRAAKRLDILQSEAKTPDQFTPAALQDFDGTAQELLSKVDDPRVASFLEDRLPQARADYAGDALRWETGQRQAQRVTQFNGAIATTANGINTNPSTYASAVGDLDASLEHGGFDPAQRDQLRQAATRQYAQSLLTGLPAQDALDRLNKGEFDSTLGADEKLQLQNHLEAKMREEAVAARTGQSKAQETAFLQGKVQVNDYSNGAGQRPLFSDQDRAAMGEDNALRLQVELGDADAKRAKADAGMNAVLSAKALGQKLNPNDSKIRDAVDKDFQQNFVPTLDQVPPEQRTEAIFGYINQLGVVPKTFASSMIETPLVSGSSDEKAQAAQIYARLVHDQPLYGQSINEKARRAASLINTYREVGMSPDQAVQAADGDMKRAETNLGKDLKTQYDRAISNGTSKPSKSVDFLRNGFSQGWLSASPAVQGSAISAFDTLAFHEYATNGANLAAAQAKALDELKTQYGVTRVNGAPMLMRHAPEQFYPVQGLTPEQNALWIKQQVVDDLNASHPYQPVRGDKVQIVPYVEATGRAVTGPDGKPAYAVTVMGDDGVPYPQIDYTPGSPNFGKPMAWVPDSQKQIDTLNNATELRNQFNLDVARYNQGFAGMTLQQREQGRKDILQKYGFPTNYRDKLDWLAPMVRPPGQRSGMGGRGGPGQDSGDAPPSDQTAFDWKGYASVVNKIETGGDRYNYTRGTDIKGSESTAVGPFQLTRRTYNGLVGAHSDLHEWTDPATPPSPADQENAFQYLTANIRRELSDAGVEASPVTTYMAHFLGTGGAKALMTAKPGTTAAAALKGVYSDDLYRKIIKDHPFLSRETVEDEYDRIAKFFEQPDPANATGADDAEMWAPRGTSDVAQSVNSPPPSSIDQAVGVAQNIQGIYDRMNAERAGERQRMIQSQRAVEMDTNTLRENIASAKSQEDKDVLIGELTDRARNAKTPAARRAILAEVDKHWAEASFKQKALIMAVHAMDAGDSGANAFASLFRGGR